MADFHDKESSQDMKGECTVEISSYLNALYLEKASPIVIYLYITTMIKDINESLYNILLGYIDSTPEYKKSIEVLSCLRTKDVFFPIFSEKASLAFCNIRFFYQQFSNYNNEEINHCDVIDYLFQTRGILYVVQNKINSDEIYRAIHTLVYGIKVALIAPYESKNSMCIMPISMLDFIELVCFMSFLFRYKVQSAGKSVTNELIDYRRKWISIFTSGSDKTIMAFTSVLKTRVHLTQNRMIQTADISYEKFKEESDEIYNYIKNKKVRQSNKKKKKSKSTESQTDIKLYDSDSHYVDKGCFYFYGYKNINVKYFYQDVNIFYDYKEPDS
uniref:Uncharacterized protein n=1 Tax=Acipenser iridovirus-European TaxID=1851774 RepID=A0A345WEF5_9VIRU|nr:hypothetical protein [Acipenser iridovirus-European]